MRNKIDTIAMIAYIIMAFSISLFCIINSVAVSKEIINTIGPGRDYETVADWEKSNVKIKNIKRTDTETTAEWEDGEWEGEIKIYLNELHELSPYGEEE